MPDIFDFFKENENKLHERPAEKVWQKLEQKLDKSRRPKRRGIRFLQPVTVALMIFLLLMTAVLVWYFIFQSGH
jgi:cell division septal protein FtsQ